MFGVSHAEVTGEQRAKAKMVSYGLAYGMEAYGLAQRLSIPTPEAQAILDAYFEAFPAVRDYMDKTVAEARERGYTETLFGRRRQIPELSSSNFRIRQAGERQAMNAGIQGLAADIFKVALVRLDHALESGDLGSRLILQVHDEVILEVPPAPPRRRGGRDAGGHVRGVRPAGAPRGQPVVRGQLGRCQGLSGGRGLSGGCRAERRCHAPARGALPYHRISMALNTRNSRFFWVMLVLLLVAMYVGLMFVSTGDNCGGDSNKHWQWAPPEWVCNAPRF